jgi:hypothetical protein
MPAPMTMYCRRREDAGGGVHSLIRTTVPAVLCLA